MELHRNSRYHLISGIYFGTVPKGFSADKNSEVQQAWVNMVKHVNPNVVIGGEYQFAKRTVGSGDSGENHRFMIVLALTSQPPESAAAEPLITFEASKNATSVQRFESLRRLYHLDEKPAFRQGL